MKTVLFVLCSLLALSSYAGDGTWVKKIAKKDLLTTQYTIFEPQRVTGEDTRIYNKMRAFVRLSYTRKSQTDVSHNYDWNMQVNFNYSLNGVTTAGSLSISNETAGRVYEDYLEIPLPSSALGYNVTITSVTGSYGTLNAGATTAVSVPQQSGFIPMDIDFIMELRSERVHNLNTAAVLDDISKINFVPANSMLYWSYQQGAEEYDLEWVFVDKYSPEYTQITTQENITDELTGFALPFELLEPTRVRVWGFNYQLDNTFPEGRLYFRVRAVSTFADQTNGVSDDIRYGKWGYCIPSTQLTLCKYEITSAQEFETNKTWLYGISYADDGKSVSTLTYFDGSNRNRQNLTYNTSDNVTLVGESKYDKEGRQVVSVIPAPVIGRNLFFQNNFNMAASGNVFDETEIEQTTVPPLATISGSAKYFSKNNDLTTDLFRDAIPNANGYVFNQKIFRNDGTGRIERVGGIGADFQTNGTHINRTWYGSTNVAELKRLFGDNVSDFPQGYRKNMLQDANGQLSVTYYDKRGNTIVTALAGEAPKTLRKLDYSEETITTPLNDNNVKIGNSMVSEHTFLNSIPNTTITLNYSLQAAVQNFQNQSVTVEGHEIIFGQLCPDCAYKLTILVKDQNGNLVGTPIEESFQPGSPCTSIGYNSPTHNVVLPQIGEYRIIKILTVDEIAMVAAFQAQLDAQGTTPFDNFLSQYSSTIDVTACIEDCDELCMYSVRLDYIQQHGDAAWAGLGKIGQKALIAACIGMECDLDNLAASDPDGPIAVEPAKGCDAQLQRMIKQISPGGVLYDDPSSSFWNTLSSFSSITIGGTSYTVSQLQNPANYTPAIASALVVHHREYCIYYNFCQQWMRLQNANLDITQKIMNTDWPSSSTGIFNAPHLEDEAYTNNILNVGTIASRVNSYGTLHNLQIFTQCNGASFPGLTSGNLYNYVDKVGDIVAIKSACDGTVMSVEDIATLKKQMFLGLYLKIQWEDIARSYIISQGCTVYDDQNAIFLIPGGGADYTVDNPMFGMVNNILIGLQNNLDCKQIATNNVNHWRAALPVDCLTALGISQPLVPIAYPSPEAIILQDGYLGTASPSLSLEQLFYNYSMVTCSSGSAPNFSGLFYDPGVGNTGKDWYEAIRTKLNVINCYTSTTAYLPFQTSVPNTSYNAAFSYYELSELKDAIIDIIHRALIGGYSGILDFKYTTNGPWMRRKTLNLSVPNLPHGYSGTIHYVEEWERDNTALNNKHTHWVDFVVTNGICTFRVPVNPSTQKGPITFRSNIIAPTGGNLGIQLTAGLSLGYNYTAIGDFSDNIPDDYRKYTTLQSDCGYTGGSIGFGVGSYTQNYLSELISDAQDDCIESQLEQAQADAQVLYNQVIENIWSNFYTKMKACLNAREDFRMSYKLKEYQYTLYYYDLAGNLVQTVPPQGVKPFSQAQIDNCLLPNNTPSFPAHDMETRNAYNGLNAMISNFTPDGGKTDLYLDKLYRVRFSQNAQQLQDYKVSYSNYDELGRVVEAGEFRKGNTDILSEWVDNKNYPVVGMIMDFTHTFYESGYVPPSTAIGYTAYPSASSPDAVLGAAFGTEGQQNLRNAIGAVMHRQADYSALGIMTPGTEVITVISYSYDAHKNVKRVVHTNYQLADIGQQHKVTDYKYDLISGNVEEVAYQKGKTDEYRHRYSYDANNRLVRSYTSHNGDYWELDAKYFYYLHGSLARRELGHDQVQGTDYAYNLQGWLKGMNSSTLNRTRDIGKDGASSSDNQYFGVDAFGFSLGYFNWDYQAIKDASESPQNYLNDYFALSIDAAALNENPDSHAANATMESLYNGNITHMVTGLRGLNGEKLDVLLNNYQYDQLHRIREMKVYNSAITHSANFIGEEAILYRSGGTTESAFQESYTFDKNGNLRTLKRNGSGWKDLNGNGLFDTGEGIALAMDNFTYNYHTQGGGAYVNNPTTSNRLSYIPDAVPTTVNYEDDIEPGQPGGNYQYNKNGELISDAQAYIQTIEWTFTGKVKKITYTDAGKTAGKRDVKFIYDPLDRRVAKLLYSKTDNTEIKWTYYSYEAGGNVLATYSRTRSLGSSDATYNYYGDSYTINDHLIYGISRLGSELENLTLVNKGFKQLKTGNNTNVELRQNWVANPPDLFLPIPDYTRRVVGDKRYELSNHLGNVMEVISDRKVKAPASETYSQVPPTYTDLAGVTVSSGVITRTVAGTGWGSSGGASVETLSQGDSFEWTLGGANAAANQYIIVGLSYTNANSGATSINYGWYTHANGLTVTELGLPPSGQTYGTHGAYAPGGVLKIVRINNSIQYYYNNVLKHTSADANPTVPMLIDFAFYEANRSIYNIKIQSSPRYAAEIMSYADYSPYGTLLGSRHGDDDRYRYGFNGMERDDELKQNGNSYDFGARIYDPRVGRWLSGDPLANRAPGLTPYRYGFNNPVRFFDPDGKWESDGHYWTVYLVARMLGIEDKDAIQLATLAEGPDHIRQHDGAWHSTSTWAIPGLQQRWHALTGGDSGVEFLNTYVDLHNKDVLTSQGFFDFGILLHRFGDVYAHRNLDNPDEMYGDDGYTTEHATACRHDGSKVGSTPDLIGNRISDGTYMEYVNDLAFLLSDKFKTSVQDIDHAVFNRMTNYVVNNKTNKSLLGIIQFEASQLDGENSLRENSFFIEYQHGHDLITLTINKFHENIYPISTHVNNIKNTIRYMTTVGGIKKEDIRIMEIFKDVEYKDINGDTRTVKEYIGTKVTYSK